MRRAMTSVEFILMAGLAVFLVTLVSLFSVHNLFNPALNTTNQSTGDLRGVRACFKVDCADVCDGSYLNHSAICDAGTCIYRQRDYCPGGCAAGRCLNQPPQASFRAACNAIAHSCAFKSTSFDPDGQIVSFHWDTGDRNSNTSYSGDYDHFYKSGGSYQVILTVTDSEGAEASSTQTVPA